MRVYRSTDEKGGLLAVDYPAFTPLLVEGLNEHGRNLEDLTHRVIELEQRDDHVVIDNTALRERRGTQRGPCSSSPRNPWNEARRVRLFHHHMSTDKTGDEEDGESGSAFSITRLLGLETQKVQALEVEVLALKKLEAEMRKLERELQELRHILLIAGIVARD